MDRKFTVSLLISLGINIALVCLLHFVTFGLPQASGVQLRFEFATPPQQTAKLPEITPPKTRKAAPVPQPGPQPREVTAPVLSKGSPTPITRPANAGEPGAVQNGGSGQGNTQPANTQGKTMSTEDEWTPPPPQPPPDPPKGETRDPKLKTGVRLSVPKEIANARELGEIDSHGTVTITWHVSASGSITGVSASPSGSFGAYAAFARKQAESAARKATFSPALSDGKAVAGTFTDTYSL